MDPTMIRRSPYASTSDPLGSNASVYPTMVAVMNSPTYSSDNPNSDRMIPVAAKTV